MTLLHTMRRGALAAAALALIACSGHGNAPAQPHAQARLQTIVVAPQTTRREQVWDGVVEATNQATMSAQTAGRVLELPYDVNDYVEAGAVIVRFSNVEQRSGTNRAQAQIAAAQAAFNEAQANYTRVADLYARKLVATAQLDQARAQRDSAHAALLAAQAAQSEASQQLDYTVVRAPYSGYVTKRFVQVGESVRPGQPLIAGVSLDALRVAVQVPQSAAEDIQRFKAADVLLDGEGARRVKAAKVTIFPYADPDTHTFSVRLELPEAKTGLFPGMTVKAAFAIGEAQRLLVPDAAFARRGEVSAVYVVGDRGASLRQVRLGRRFGDAVEVLSGLDAGEKVAADPAAAAAAVAADNARGG